ncbi:MAG: P-loop NTPase [Haloferacaceae archaeon]
MGRVYTVASGKGGVGKTTTTAALGATLASAGASVAVVDADLGMANLAPALGVDDDPPTLHDVLAGTASVADATRPGPDGLAVLPGSRDLDAFADARPGELADTVGALAEEYDHVIVDSGAGLSTDSLAPLRAADEVVLVATPDRDALRNADKTAEVCHRLGTPIRGYVLTRADAAAGDRADDREVLGTVSDDPAVRAALEAATSLPQHAPGSPAAAAYRDLARTLTGADVPDPEPTAADAEADEPEDDARAGGADAAEAVPTEEAAAPADGTTADEGSADETTAESGTASDVTIDETTAAEAAGDDTDVSADADGGDDGSEDADADADADADTGDDGSGDADADDSPDTDDGGDDPDDGPGTDDGGDGGDDPDDGGRKGFLARLFG